ncbi:MAG: hypothetical protein IJ068_01015 [Bacilli bacterium]|nr:hypothetical protein [Bacilli bacterium]
MLKILNKIILHLKNIILILLVPVTIYIVGYMFERIGKEMFGEHLLEFIDVLFPFILLIILNLINLFAKQEEVKDNFYYNITSLLCMIVISIFCYRALMDSNMYFLNKYKYHINFNYFSDQIAPIKVMLYGLSVSNILLMISNAIKIENKEIKETKKVNKSK